MANIFISCHAYCRYIEILFIQIPNLLDPLLIMVISYSNKEPHLPLYHRFGFFSILITASTTGFFCDPMTSI